MPSMCRSAQLCLKRVGPLGKTCQISHYATLPWFCIACGSTAHKHGWRWGRPSLSWSSAQQAHSPQKQVAFLCCFLAMVLHLLPFVQPRPFERRHCHARALGMQLLPA